MRTISDIIDNLEKLLPSVTDQDVIFGDIAYLSRLENLEIKSVRDSWSNDVDRQSGAFTAEEIANSTAWR